MILKQGIVITTDSPQIEWTRLLETIRQRLTETLNMKVKSYTTLNIMDITLKSCYPTHDVRIQVDYRTVLGDMEVTVTNMDLGLFDVISECVVKRSVNETPLSQHLAENPELLERYGSDMGKVYNYKFNYNSNGRKRASIMRVLERVPKALDTKLAQYQSQWQ